MENINIKGLVAAVVTPMTAKADLDTGPIPEIISHLVKNKVAGIYLAGSTGEGLSLTDAERRELAEAYVTEAKGKMKSVVQVGHNSMRAAAELAAHAESVGADAVSATPPGYFRTDNEEDLVEALRPVAEAAPATPFYYYHIPALSGVVINPMVFTQLASERLVTFRGIKYSDGPTLYNLPLLQKAAPRLEFLAGSDESYLQSHALGYRGAVGSTYNYAAPIYQKVATAIDCGDLEAARLWQERALLMIEAMFKHCGRASLKAMMRMVGIDCGPVRLPLKAASEAQVANLRTALEKMGWFEWIALDSDDK